ncbi:MAG: type II toxin-antitoxin system VapC family toxin [Ancalomicrobiaceae bacterium]|nr:type II toxin-antitoxin system VapC family toxin [Ancalomicrobiaceae bacterium]
MFVDTSVIVAILADEPDAGTYADKLAAADRRYTSGLVVLEAAMRLSSLLNVDPVEVERRITQVLQAGEMTIVPIDAEIARQAVAAFARYGKGRGHKAQLNLADCMSYACAQVMDMPLLYKGNDFSATDIRAA